MGYDFSRLAYKKPTQDENMQFDAHRDQEDQGFYDDANEAHEEYLETVAENY